MTDEPPLPATDDPFALLGVARDVDERELKRAYARLIKRFRPDRAPAEFARIQAAYEHVTQVIKLGAAADDDDDDAAADNAPRRPNADDLAPRRPNADDATATATAAPTAPVDVVARLAALVDADRLDDAIALLDDPEVADRATADVGLALRALSTIAAAAWHTPRAERALARYVHLPRLAMVERGLDIAELETIAAAAVRALDGFELPAPLLRLLGGRWLPSDGAYEQRRAELARAMAAAPETYLAAFDALATRLAPGALDTVAAVLGLGLPPPARRHRVPAAVAAALDARLRTGLPSAAPALGLAAIAILGVASQAIDPVAPFVAVPVSSAPMLWWLRRRPWLARGYSPALRGELARLMIDLGVTPAIIATALAARRSLTSGHRAWLDRLRADPGLALLGLMAVLVRPTRPGWHGAMAAAAPEPISV